MIRLIKEVLANTNSIQDIAEQVFKMNTVDSEVEFAVVLYKDKSGKIVTGKPLAGESDVSVAIETEDFGTPVAVVHSHPDQIAEASSWDTEFGEAMANQTGTNFIIYTIGHDVETDDLTMVSDEFEPIE